MVVLPAALEHKSHPLVRDDIGEGRAVNFLLRSDTMKTLLKPRF